MRLGLRLSVFLGALPVLLVGFVSSVLADRLLFLLWGLVVALLYTLTVVRARRAERGLGIPVAVLGLGGVSYAALLARYGEELSLGAAAFLPPSPAA